MSMGRRGWEIAAGWIGRPWFWRELGGYVLGILIAGLAAYLATRYGLRER